MHHNLEKVQVVVLHHHLYSGIAAAVRRLFGTTVRKRLFGGQNRTSKKSFCEK